MDDTAQDTGENDAFARLLAQLSAPTTDPVAGPISLPVATAPSVTAPIEASFPEPGGAWGHAARAPELLGADELAAEPRPFPPVALDATPLIAPPPAPAAVPIPHAEPAPASARHLSAPPPAAPRIAAPPLASPVDPVRASVPTAVPAAALPASAVQVDFARLLAAPAQPAPGSVSPSGQSFPFGAERQSADEPDISRSTGVEKVILALAILLPPLGLLAALVAAIRSAQRRGWVIGLLRAAIAIGVVFSVVAGIGGYIGYTALLQQQTHDRTAAASSAFCSTIKADPTMIQSPAFGWPAVATTITDSLTAMQAYEDKWTKLAKVSPPGIRPEVTKVAAAAQQIIDSVTVARTVDEAGNISIMTGTASASSVPGWYAEYCK